MTKNGAYAILAFKETFGKKVKRYIKIKYNSKKMLK
jgi:hypothetical protein